MLLDDLNTYLAANGIAVPIHLGSMQETPDTIVALRETGGFPGAYVMTPGQAVLEEPTVQVLARAVAYNSAEALIRSVKALLDGFRNTSVNGVLYHFAQALQPPFILERDQNLRFVLAFNVHIKRQTVP
jgi:hypothetical protein